MNDLRKEVEDALKEGEIYDRFGARWGKERIEVLRAALAQPDESFCDTHCTWLQHHPDCFMARTEKGPEPEPVAYLWQHGETGRTRVIEKDQVWTASNQWNRVGPLYLHPPQRKPLTRQEVDAIWATKTDIESVVRAVEAAHGVRNE